MEMVDLLASMLARQPHELSGRQQQRFALARVLTRYPLVMPLDEPFSALDPGLRENRRKATAEALRATGSTTILVAHDQAEALSFADQIAVLREDRLAEAGSPTDLCLQPRRRETALFLGDAIMLRAEREGGPL
ncbi:ATP-binding cassette domain-containing protein [Microvirga sp. M2]|uniref:ATP-binding cassette domain-containing protein n=1 Tax=Microvirga sp. M2 TaxID=3073270 RepID=UPI0039C0A88F